MIKIAMIPIDNRPACYNMPNEITDFSQDVEFILPPRKFLGSLQTTANVEEILSWLENIKDVDILIVALDTIAYGGLVSSRRTTETFDQISTKLNKLKNIIEEKKIKTYACSSIMRISNNNINEEEKEYWNLWGKKIFDYSFNLHKAQKSLSYDANAKFSCIGRTIPSDILDDYFATRKRNFEINKMYLEWQKQGIFEYLVFSKDDCAQYGINVAEAQELQKTISEQNLNAIVKTGADEIPLSLLARAFTIAKKQKLKIYPKFTRPEQTQLISKYEDVSILNSVIGQIELCGCEYTPQENEADVILLVNNFETEQGELVMDVPTKPFSGSLDLPNKPYMIADVCYANGADNSFIKALFATHINWQNFGGYAGWNTSANTLGSVICAGLFKFLSYKIDLELFKKHEFVRFSDDWAYQANCRAKLKKLYKTTDTAKITELMNGYIPQIKTFLEIKKSTTKYMFPWQRVFEIEIVIDN